MLKMDQSKEGQCRSLSPPPAVKSQLDSREQNCTSRAQLTKGLAQKWQSLAHTHRVGCLMSELLPPRKVGACSYEWI